MRPSDYGPVPISQIKTESPHIFQALSDDRRVLISKRGAVVAAIDPPSEHDRDWLIAYATPGLEPLPELTATNMNRGSPSLAINLALEGTPSVVTRDSKVYGILHALTSAEMADEGLTLDQIRERERRVSDFLESHPNATATDLVEFTDGATRAIAEPSTQAERTLSEVVTRVLDFKAHPSSHPVRHRASAHPELTGPVELITFGFGHQDSLVEIGKELEKLRESGAIRVIDALMISKDTKGDTAVAEFGDLWTKESDEFDIALDALIDVSSDMEAWDVLREMPNDSAAALVLIEWAVSLSDIVSRGGDFRISHDLISGPGLVATGLLPQEEDEEFAAIDLTGTAGTAKSQARGS